MSKKSIDQLTTLFGSLSEADADELERLLGVGKADRGVTQINLGPLFNWIEANHERAQAAIAASALAYYRFGSTGGQVAGAHLGLLFTLYQGIFDRRGGRPDAVTMLRAILQDAVPDLPKLQQETFEVMRLNKII